LNTDKEKMQRIMLRLINEYNAKTPYKKIVDLLKGDVPEINIAWIKNKTKLLRKHNYISTVSRGLNWENIIKELPLNKLESSPCIPNDDSVPTSCLLEEANVYKPDKDTYTNGVAKGFQRYSGIFRLVYIGQVLAYAKKENLDTKDLLDEALRIWVKIKWIASQKNISTDQVVAELLNN
jgi:hypothetical protein